MNVRALAPALALALAVLCIGAAHADTDTPTATPTATPTPTGTPNPFLTATLAPPTNTLIPPTASPVPTGQMPLGAEPCNVGLSGDIVYQSGPLTPYSLDDVTGYKTSYGPPYYEWLNGGGAATIELSLAQPVWLDFDGIMNFGGGGGGGGGIAVWFYGQNGEAYYSLNDGGVSGGFYGTVSGPAHGDFREITGVRIDWNTGYAWTSGVGVSGYCAPAIALTSAPTVAPWPTAHIAPLPLCTSSAPTETPTPGFLPTVILPTLPSASTQDVQAFIHYVHTIPCVDGVCAYVNPVGVDVEALEAAQWSASKPVTVSVVYSPGWASLAPSGVYSAGVYSALDAYPLPTYAPALQSICAGAGTPQAVTPPPYLAVSVGSYLEFSPPDAVQSVSWCTSIINPAYGPTPTMVIPTEACTVITDTTYLTAPPIAYLGPLTYTPCDSGSTYNMLPSLSVYIPAISQVNWSGGYVGIPGVKMCVATYAVSGLLLGIDIGDLTAIILDLIAAGIIIGIIRN